MSSLDDEKCLKLNAFALAGLNERAICKYSISRASIWKL